jgi:hypothetical protein
MSIREVAARAGVSAATVSRVFTQPDAVAVETRQRVMAVAEDMRYTPHPVARSLARGRCSSRDPTSRPMTSSGGRGRWRPRSTVCCSSRR